MTCFMVKLILIEPKPSMKPK